MLPKPWFDLEELESSDAEKARSAAMLGLSEYECPVCRAPVKESPEGSGRYICLNACHLGEAGARRFHEHLRKSMRHEGG